MKLTDAQREAIDVADAQVNNVLLPLYSDLLTNKPTLKIVVRIASVYGNRTIYPVDSNAQLFAQIAGTKTLTDATVALIKKLGYTVEVLQGPNRL